MVEYGPVQRNQRRQVLELVEALQKERAKMSFVHATPEEVDRWFEEEATSLFGAFFEGKLVGLLKSKVKGRKNQNYWSFLSIAILKDYREQGMAKALTDVSCLALRKKGIWLVRAYIYSDNLASIATAKAAGFVCSGRVVAHHRDEKTGDFVDDLIFHRDLREEEASWTKSWIDCPLEKTRAGGSSV